jgi:hypothetical protein
MRLSAVANTSDTDCDQARNRRVGTFGVAVAAGRAVLGDPLRMLEADARHVAVDAGRRRHQRGADEGIDQVVVALAGQVEVAGLLPEAVQCRRVLPSPTGIGQHDRQAGILLHRLLARDADFLVGDLGQFGEAAAHHAQVVGHHARALAAELGLQLRLDRGEQRVLGQAGIGHGRTGGKEGALEGDALHAQHAVRRAAGFLAGDLEGVEVEHADLVVDDELLRPEREAGPGLLAQVGLDDEEAALLQARQRIAVAEHRRVGREHDVHEARIRS